MAFWNRNPLAIACFFYLVQKHQRQVLPDAARGSLAVAIDDTSEFAKIGADGTLSAEVQAFHYRINLLRDEGFIAARRAHCPHCYYRFSAPRQGRKYSCPSHGRVNAVNVVELDAGAIRELGMFLGQEQYPQAATVGVPQAFVPPVAVSLMPTVSIPELRPRTGPTSFHDVLTQEGTPLPEEQVPEAPVSYESEARIVPPPSGWTVHPNGWYIDSNGAPHPPWNPMLGYPPAAWDTVLASQAIPANITETGIAHHMHNSTDAQRRQNLTLIVHGSDIETGRDGEPLLALPEMLDADFALPPPMVEMEEVRKVVAEARQSGAAWQFLYNIHRPSEQLVSSKVSEAIYGAPWPEVKDGEFARLHEFGLSPNFVRCARAFSPNLTLEELGEVPPAIRAAKVECPYDTPEDWKHVFYGIAQLEDLYRVRTIPEVEARFSYYLLDLLGGDTDNRVLGNSEWMAQVAATELNGASHNAYGDLYSLFNVPSFPAIVRDVLERFSVQLDTHQWRVCLYGCIAHANALTIRDIGEWTRGASVLFAAPDWCVPEAVGRTPS